MFHTINENNGFKIRFSATLRHIDVACGCLEQFLEQVDLGELKFDLILGAREILNNSVIHGSGADSEMTVRFSVDIVNGSIVMRAADEGPGFDYETLRRDCHITETCGRGAGILESYFDTVLYRPPGNRVELQKTIERFRSRRKIYMTEKQINGDRAELKLGSDIISTTVDALKDEFKQALRGGINQLVLDLEAVTYVDSMGLGLLVATHNSLQKTGHRLQLTHVSDDINKLLKRMRLDLHFEIIQS